MIGEHDAPAPGRAAGELEHGLHRLGAAVREEAPVGVVRHARNERLGEEPGQGLALHLHEVGKLQRHRVAECLLDHGMTPAEREHTEAGEKVEVSRAIAIEEVRTLGSHVVTVETERAQDLRHLRIDVALVQRERLTPSLFEKSLHIERAHYLRTLSGAGTTSVRRSISGPSLPASRMRRAWESFTKPLSRYQRTARVNASRAGALV